MNGPEHLHARRGYWRDPVDKPVHFSDHRTLHAQVRRYFLRGLSGTGNVVLQVFHHFLCPLCGAREQELKIHYVAFY